MLGYEVRKPGAPHNCLDDAMAAMKLVLAKMEKGVDKAIQLVEEPVSLMCIIIMLTLLLVET